MPSSAQQPLLRAAASCPSISAVTRAATRTARWLPCPHQCISPIQDFPHLPWEQDRQYRRFDRNWPVLIRTPTGTWAGMKKRAAPLSCQNHSATPERISMHMHIPSVRLYVRSTCTQGTCACCRVAPCTQLQCGGLHSVLRDGVDFLDAAGAGRAHPLGVSCRSVFSGSV